MLATDDVETRPRRRASTRDAVPGSHRDSAPALEAATPTRGRSAARARGGTPAPPRVGSSSAAGTAPQSLGFVTPPGFVGNPLDGMGESVSPGPDSSHEDLRQWSVDTFQCHETILRDVFTRLANENAVLTQRMDILERDNMQAAQVVHTVVTNLDETRNVSVNADNALRQELSAFADQLKASDD